MALSCWEASHSLIGGDHLQFSADHLILNKAQTRLICAKKSLNSACTLPSEKRWDHRGNRNLQHGGLRFGPGLRYGAPDGVKIVEECRIAAVTLRQRDDVNTGEIEGGNAGRVFMRRERLENGVFPVAQNNEQNRQMVLHRGPDRLDRILERSVADDHDHGTVAT